MGDWGGNVILYLKPLSVRSRSASDIVDSIRPMVTSLPSIDVYPWSWDSGLPGIDDSLTGSELSLVISTTETYPRLFEEIEKTRKFIDEKKFFLSVRHDLKLDAAGYKVDVNTHEMSYLNLTARQIAKTIEIFFSGDQSLTFSKDGILYNLTLKGATAPWSLNELYITNSMGKPISLGTVAKMVPMTQPEKLHHFNQMRSVTLTADMDKNEKIEKAIPKLLNAVEQTLPSNYKKTWTGAAKLYSESQTTMIVLFILAILFIFAILSIQFENFIDPFIILLTVPLACSGALALVWAFDQSLNIYTQVGLITLVGLITKHGILIVEFANQLQREGVNLLDAIVRAASLRLRPILMTTGAMIFGAIPLILSRDAGYESRHAIGTVLIGGLSFGTLFTLFFLPTVYWMIKSFKSLR